MRWAIIGLAVLMVLVAAGQGYAALTFFTDRAAFQAAASGPLTLETFEDDPVALLTVPHVFLGSGLGVTTDPTNVTTEVTTVENYSYNTTPGGEKHLRFVYDPDYTASGFTANPMTAFGMDLSGFQDFLGYLFADGYLSKQVRDKLTADTVEVSDLLPYPGGYHVAKIPVYLREILDIYAVF